MDTPQHDQAWPGLMAPHLPLPTQDLSTPGGQASSVTMPSPAPPRQASAPGLKPPPSSAPKSTVSLFWVTTRHTQGISISACGASDSLRLTQDSFRVHASYFCTLGCPSHPPGTPRQLQTNLGLHNLEIKSAPHSPAPSGPSHSHPMHRDPCSWHTRWGSFGLRAQALE